MLRATAAWRGPPPTTTATTTPLKLLVLTMTPNGGAVAKALRILGYHPYLLEHSYRAGRVMSHTKEWHAVLLGQKPFDPIILQATPRVADGESPGKGTNAAEAGVDDEAVRGFDALVGPPATLAYESVLRACPRSTRVILVEEPDKLAWESEYELLLKPILRHTTGRWRLGPMVDLGNMLVAMSDVRRCVSLPRRPDTSGSARKVGALQASALKRGAALDLFEAQVKETVPQGRLLVYRAGDGWGPLCSFLGVRVPTERRSVQGEGCEVPIPFPPHDPGVTVLSSLQERLRGADRAVFIVFVAFVACVLALLPALHAPLKMVMERYYKRFNELLTPYFDSYRYDGTPITFRGALKLAKKATMDLEKEVREEGGVVSGFKDAMQALAHPHGNPGQREG